MINIFCDDMDDLALQQWNECINHPAFRKGALMPDAHGGYDAPIGSVLALKDWVMPSWVGYDIGCGMCALPLAINRYELGDLQELHSKIHKAVPCGFSVHQAQTRLPLGINRSGEAIRQAFEKRKVAEQFGTLGGGNHFIELGEGNDGMIYIVIHSGSRGFGHEIATYWMKRQKEETNNIGWYAHSKDGKQYIQDMNIALVYALNNRKRMIELVCEVLNTKPIFGSMINRNHNHLDMAHGLYIHRKGATHSEKDMLGVIPANMRDGSYIVKGLGNPDSLWSSSHGAGRKMSRKVAKENITLEKFQSDMVGIVGDVKEKTIDEAPDAYKDINKVIKTQVDAGIIEVVDIVKPFLNVKG